MVLPLRTTLVMSQILFILHRRNIIESGGYLSEKMLKIGQTLHYNPAYLYITYIYIVILIVHLSRLFEIF